MLLPFNILKYNNTNCINNYNHHKKNNNTDDKIKKTEEQSKKNNENKTHKETEKSNRFSEKC